METCFNYSTPDMGFFSSDERRHINRIHRLKEQYPDQVEIIREPDENDGCIYARVPVRWLRVQPPVKKVMTEEQRQVASERMRNMRRNQLNNQE